MVNSIFISLALVIAASVAQAHSGECMTIKNEVNTKELILCADSSYRLGGIVTMENPHFRGEDGKIIPLVVYTKASYDVTPNEVCNLLDQGKGEGFSTAVAGDGIDGGLAWLIESFYSAASKLRPEMIAAGKKSYYARVTYIACSEK